LAQTAAPAATTQGSAGVVPEAPPGTATGDLLKADTGNLPSFSCKDLDIRLALRLLGANSRKNIICTKEVSGTVSTDLYGVTFKEALDALMRISGYQYREKDNFIYVMTPQQYAEALKDEKKLSVRTFHLSYITAADAKALIAPAMSKDGTAVMTPPASAGIDPSKTATGGNSLALQDILIVSDYDEELDKVAKIIQEVDVKPEQILVEATILRCTLTEENALGVNFNALSGVDFAKLSTVTDATSLQALTTGGFTDASKTAGQLSTGTVAGVGNGGLSFGFFSNNIALFIKALETVTDVTVLANPKLLIVNKQRGEVLIGDHTGYLTSSTTETVSTQTVQFFDTGTRLLVRPFIGRDGFIRMELHPEDSTVTIQQVTGNTIPSSKTTEATSNILVRDGHTIVIGGLFRESTTHGRTQVPILGNIPGLGTLFRQTDDTTIRDEIIILITPRIVRQENDEAISEQLKDDVERFRMGQRKGVGWWGRDRLAQIHIRQAKQDLADGRRANALWNVDMALSCQPRMEEAIRLKERITETAFWHNEAQDSSILWGIQRMMMNDLGKPVERMVPPDQPRDASRETPDVREKFGTQPRIEDPLPGAGLVPGRIRMTPPQEAAPSTPPVAPPAETPPAHSAVPAPVPAQPQAAAPAPQAAEAVASAVVPAEAKAPAVLPDAPPAPAVLPDAPPAPAVLPDAPPAPAVLPDAPPAPAVLPDAPQAPAALIEVPAAPAPSPAPAPEKASPADPAPSPLLQDSPADADEDDED
jgi:type IV pilus assembly protein PilQ